MKRLFLILFVFVAVSAFAQDRPHNTLEQCGADGVANESYAGRAELLTIPYSELDRRATEMAYCIFDYARPASPRDKENWSFTMSMINGEKLRRLTDFVGRHGVYPRFMSEDAAGAR
jgi:hypothetical protein